VDLKDRIIICADAFWPALSGSGVIEHVAESGTIDVAGVYSKANDAPSVLVHNDHCPVNFHRYRFAAEQIYAV